ncbi:acetylxylan esterase, partial [Streptomyces clavuligerus]
MTLYDLPLDALRSYRSASAEPDDFDGFWADTLARARSHDLGARFEPVDAGLTTVEVYDVTYAGFGGHPIRAWLVLPAGESGPLPVVVESIGYGGGRGLPHAHLLWASAGFAHFVMDSRGQGSMWSEGVTADPVGSAPSHPGFLTQGIEAPETFYYRRLITDAVRAVEAAHAHPRVDAARTAVIGESQGGGVALALAALLPGLLAIAPDMPFLCDFPRAVTITDHIPYSEVGNYLRTHRTSGERVRRTLSYFDGVHFAARCRAPALFSVALQDTTCP